MSDAGAASLADLEVRPPKQRRSREAWNRVLDAGVAILEDGGYDAFTIAAVCDRASVAPPSIYARTTSKDALFLAVYEHGIARLRAGQEVFADVERWAGLAPAELVRSAVAEMAGISLRNQRFLGAVVLISAAHAEVRRRGSRYAQELGDGFTGVVVRAADAITHRGSRGRSPSLLRHGVRDPDVPDGIRRRLRPAVPRGRRRLRRRPR